MNTAEHSETTLAAALALAAKKIPIFPCNPLNKQPLTWNGFKGATTDSTKIERWWAENPNAMIGMRTGAASGVLAIDLDLKPEKGINGIATLKSLVAKHGTLPLTPMQRTPSDGVHILFCMPQNVSIPCSVGKVGPGVDVRGDGGYIVVAPSVNAAGRSYKWERTLDDKPLAPPPAWLLDLIGEKPSSESKRRPIGDKSLMARNLEMFGRAVDKLPNELSYSEWIKALAAMKAACGGDESFYLDHVAPWCRKYSANTDEVIRDKWDSINEAELGADYVYGLARQLTKDFPADQRFAETEDFDEVPPDAAGGTADQTQQKSRERGHMPKFAKLPLDFDATKLPMFEWTLGTSAMRGTITAIIGPSSASKSTLALLRAISIVTGRKLTGEEVRERGSVLVYNAEDSLVVMQKRVAAILKHYRIPYEEVQPNLHLASGMDNRLIMATKLHDKVIIEPAVDELVEFIRKNKIVHLSFDPLINTSRGLTENSNDDMEELASTYLTVAAKTGSSVDIVHHTPKHAQNQRGIWMRRAAQAVLGQPFAPP